MNIGERIRSRRMQLRYSIAEVSRRSGLSSPFLSQLERGHTQASLDSLNKIAGALEISLGYFVDQSGEQGWVRTPEQFHYFSMEDSRVLYARMGSGDNHSQLEPVLMVLPGFAGINSLRHLGEAFFMVLRGELRVCLEDREYLLEEGHAAHVKPGMHYSWHNDKPGEVRLIWVGTPKLF